MSVLAGIITSLALSLSAPGPAPASPAAPAAGLRASGSYVHVSPGVLAWFLGSPVMIYAWGVDAGYHFARGRRFAAQVGGFLHHFAQGRPAFALSGTWPRTDFVRLGPEVRVGASRERVFGYVVVRAGLDLQVHTADDPQRTRELSLRFMGAVGLGIQGALGPRRRLLLGFEPAVSFPQPTLEPRLLLGWRF